MCFGIHSDSIDDATGANKLTGPWKKHYAELLYRINNKVSYCVNGESSTFFL